MSGKEAQLQFQYPPTVKIEATIMSKIFEDFFMITQFPFTASEWRLDYYHQNLNVRVASRFAEPLKTWDLQKLGSFKEFFRMFPNSLQYFMQELPRKYIYNNLWARLHEIYIFVIFQYYLQYLKVHSIFELIFRTSGLPQRLALEKLFWTLMSSINFVKIVPLQPGQQSYLYTFFTYQHHFRSPQVKGNQIIIIKR